MHRQPSHARLARRIAVRHAKDAGCKWLEVDFVEDLAPFYYDACGFAPTPAGLLRLPDLPSWSAPLKVNGRDADI
jgi:hypothetical protein